MIRSIALALALSFAALSAQAATCPPADAAVAAKMTRMVNAERAKKKLPVLKSDTRLARAAQAHACDMVTRKFFSHTGSDRSTVKVRVGRTGYRTCLTAENLAYGWRTPEAVMKDLMKSTGHRANILRKGVKSIGIGYIPPQKEKGPWWVQVFAAPC